MDNKPRVVPLRTNGKGELLCPGCGQPHLTADKMTEDGPSFICGSCSVMPTLSLMSNDETTKIFWSIF